MRSSVTSCSTMVWLVAAALLLAAFVYTASAQRREYDVYTVEPYKSDIAHLVEAYERLSDQYLSLVQHQLKNMDLADREIIGRLQALERKIDDLAAKVDKLTPAAPPASDTPASQDTPAAAAK